MSAAVIHLNEFEHPCALCGVNTQVEFLDRVGGYESLVCPSCWEVEDAELHADGCDCRHCVARRNATVARTRAVTPEHREWAARQQGWIDEDGKG